MENKEYFNEVAGQWDTMRQNFFSDEVRETALKIAEVEAGKTAADIGAGTGFLTEALLKRGLKVVAIDHSSEMLQQVVRKFADAERLEVRLGGSAQLPLPEKSVDYAFANMYLHHVESPAEAIREMTRILKPGGVMVITDLRAHNFEFLKTEQHDRWLGFEFDDIRRWFVEAGLRDVSVSEIGQNCTSTSNCGSERAAISIFAAAGRK
jgi:ubiquinone/menaquinone biosynthesis C-methylase UbiE